MRAIDDETHEHIKRLCTEGDTLAEEEDYLGAVDKYDEAFQLIPEPKDDWNATTWVLTAIGDAHFLGGRYKAGREALAHAVACPGGLGNPFIHLRLGQCELELGNLDLAAEELCRAYMGDGKRIFESEDPKYFAFLKTRIRPPASGEW